MDNAPVWHAVVRILARYMRHHPHACDSVTGIRRWWIDEGIAVTADELDEALTWMKHHGLIDETVAADGRVRLRRCASDAQLDALAQSRNGDAAGMP